MKYHLLTGCTGFLGRYIMKDCLLAGIPLAVMIRSNKRETTRQRLEAVLGYWEQRLGRRWPRPVVLSGDVRQPDCGLDAASLRWVREHCDSIVHSGASMNFHASQPQGEPFHTNIVGTGNVLAMCEATGIRHFHQVSTAYICGLRTGRVLETELDLGQELGNDYERSKLAAEKLIRQAPFLETATFYRPASIVGDSETGYTTNFHGFYAPLNVLYSMAKGLLVLGDMGRQFIHEAINRTKFMDRLNMTGNEGKNLVPIDWCSAVIVHVLQRPHLHGRTYHLTPRERVTVQMVREVFEEVLRDFADIPETFELPDIDVQSTDREASERMFQDQMSVYNSHWRDDPMFDYTNTATYVPELPCPKVDREMLLRTGRFSVNTNFGWPRPKPIEVAFDAAGFLQPLVDAGQERAGAANTERFNLQVVGPGGGQWNLLVEGNQPIAAEAGSAADCAANYYLNSDTFASLARRERTVEQAVYSGSLVIEGPRAADSQTQDVLRGIVAANPA